VTVRNPHFRTIHSPLGADILVVQEMQSQAGVDSFRNNVLNVLQPGQWASAPFINGNDTDNALFYKPSRVQFLGGWGFYPNPATNLRLVNVYRLKPVGYSSASAELRIYSQHLKAGNSSSEESQRAAEAIGIRDSMNSVPPGTHCILTGDFNIYRGDEAAFTRFLESQADNDGRLYDPLNAPLITWNTDSLATIHTQSPCNGAGCASGAATGGLDDRFDMFLPTLNLNDGEGLDLLVSTYVPVGNDGQHYNVAITDLPIIPEGSAYATALISASDHLPTRVDVQLPALSSVPGPLAFGTVIAGATAQQNLAVSNTAVAPADELDYTLAAPAGFSAPAGTFQAQAGDAPNSHVITMDTGTSGVKAGNLVLSSDDPENPTRNVALSGTVLRHAQPSLDSLASLLAADLDFGSHDAGEFSDMVTKVYNLGYDPLQAQLNLTAANIAGGAGRFSIAGGFSPVPVSATPASYAVHFDDSGATTDSTYTAALTFTSTDQALPGALPRPDLVVSLSARVNAAGPVGVDTRERPAMTRLFGALPNPAVGGTALRFDLAEGAPVTLDLFDLRGARVRSLAHGQLEPGRYSYTWDGADDGGAQLPAGVYFVRFAAPGLRASQRLVLLR
jgi:hypothetical protein